MLLGHLPHLHIVPEQDGQGDDVCDRYRQQNNKGGTKVVWEETRKKHHPNAIILILIINRLMTYL